ncbi:MAG: hypothetical protein AAFR12_20635 [Cyanobacteria bacterium J06626_6]
MSSVKNMWGELPKTEELPDLPIKVLKEQGSLLTEATDGTLIGEVAVLNGDSSKFRAALRIKAPSLNNYIFSILQIEYPLMIYPVDIVDQTVNRRSICKNLKEYEERLEQVLSSDRVKSVILALLAQISANTSLEDAYEAAGR